MENLYRAWVIVRRNVLASGREHFKTEVRRISENPLPYLRRIQDRLQPRKFVFAPQHAVLKKKASGKKRPIVVSPIENRIVQRALLNVLQSEDLRIASRLGRIVEALRTPTSVGGIPERGVPEAMVLIRRAIEAGATHYLRSDIQDFFTKVPRTQVIEFVRSETKEDAFADLVDAAMAVELENADDVKGDLHLFPNDEVGVPQGSSLSAFAGNIVLESFDKQLNGRGITAIRYIDDFVVLGPSGKSVLAAFESGRKLLTSINMTAYAPEQHSDKASAGEVTAGFNFLGCELRAGRIGPSTKSVQTLLKEIQDTFRIGLMSIRELASAGAVRRAENAYAQVLTQVDRKVRGWGDAFAFADNRQPFMQADRQIDAMLGGFRDRANRLLRAATQDGRRRGLGIALLKETPPPTASGHLPAEDRKPSVRDHRRQVILTVVLPPDGVLDRSASVASTPARPPIGRKLSARDRQ